MEDPQRPDHGHRRRRKDALEHLSPCSSSVSVSVSLHDTTWASTSERLLSTPQIQNFSKSILCRKSYGPVQMHLYERVNLLICKILQSEDLLRMRCRTLSCSSFGISKFVRHWRLREKCRGCKWVLPCRNTQFCTNELNSTDNRLSADAAPTKINFLSWMK